VIFNDPMNWVALAWFLTCWIGYTIYAKHRASRGNSLSSVLLQFRIDWMRQLLRREARIADLALLNNLVQMVNFLATTNIFVLAGSVTVLYSAKNIMTLLQGHPFIAETSTEEVQAKLLVLVVIFIYSFFRFTWAMRQHTFVSILIGAAPRATGEALTPEEEEYAVQAGKISDRAAHDFNYGLRSYYFALSLLAWFIGPWALIPTCTAVVVVLYIREFKSRALRYLVASRESYQSIKALAKAA